MRSPSAAVVVLALAVTCPPAVRARAEGRPALVTLPVEQLVAEVRKPGPRAVLVNVWASWCDPCREELPELLRFYRSHKREGLRLVLVSADDKSTADEARTFLASLGVDFVSYRKGASDDMAFIDALDSPVDRELARLVPVRRLG